jgi:LAS superfamily LD-carboxypeptidase LdcB
VNKAKNYILKLILSLAVLALAFVALIPYFNSSFAELRQEKESAAASQRLLLEEKAREASKKKEEQKNYLTGKFDQSKREDFVLVPKEYILYEEGKGGMYLRKEAYRAYLEMQRAAEVSRVELKIVSATRNFDYQKEIWDKKWTGVTLVDEKNLSESLPDGLQRFRKILEYSAAPGTSRHHWGTEIDINEVNPPYFKSEKGKREYAWLVQNAGVFGFCQTYNAKNNSRPTGYNEEKWHWSYLPLARPFTEDYKNLITAKDLNGFLGEEFTTDLNLIENYVLSINPDCI